MTEHSHRKLRELQNVVTGPAIPYLGVYMNDLLYIEDGNADITEDGPVIRHPPFLHSPPQVFATSRSAT